MIQTVSALSALFVLFPLNHRGLADLLTRGLAARANPHDLWMGPVSLSGQYEGAPRRRAVELRAHCSDASVGNDGGGGQRDCCGRSTSASSATVGLG